MFQFTDDTRDTAEMETSLTSTDRTSHRIASMLLTGALVLAISLLAIPTSAQDNAQIQRVHLILSNDGASYRAFEREFRERLRQDSVTADLETTTILADEYGPHENESAVPVAVGSSALESALNKTEGPVVTAMVPSWIVARWQARNPHRNISGIFIDQPAHRHVALVRALMPTAVSLGLLSGMEATTESDFRKAADRHDLFLFHEIAEDRSNLLRGVRQLASETDAILILPSPLTTEARNLRSLLLQSFRAGVPVIGFSPGLVEAGAIAAVYSAPEDIGADTADLLTEIYDSEPSDWPSTRHPDRFQVTVNRQVARAIGLNLPPDADIYRFIDRSRP